MTARRVAGYRLTFDRITATYGDPAADDALARDVAGTASPRPGPMREYLRARTRFFDGVVTRALGGGCTQVVTGAAGYDGRSLRYERPGTLWFEVDHPATQRDKRARLGRLGIHSQVRFVAADFTTDPVADLLLAAGLDPCVPSLFLLEGVAVYLEEAVLASLLAQLRRVAADGSTLAISLSVDTGTPERAARRAAFQAAVAAVGEPARSLLKAGQAADLLEAAGWRPGAGCWCRPSEEGAPGDPHAPSGPPEPSAQPGQGARHAADRHRAAGFILAAPM